MSPVARETTVLETASCSETSRRFGGLRGVQWRIDLGILPSSPSASIDDLRRVTANSRRTYAALRRQLLVDPHVPKDGSNSPDLVMDNPLSQNPDSMWGRFFRNAELERMLDQDLTRLYPERGSYFQTSGCQGMLRRILLLWCLRHPEYGYRQGMHELLAPLLYVLHVDVERLSEVRKLHDDHFSDKFDGFSFHENDLTYKFDFKKFSDSEEDWDGFEKNSIKPNTLNELDPEIQTIVLLSDAYGAEGELGIVLSEKFTEHDAYSMFNALMSDAGGAVSMAEFFSHSPFKSSHTGFPPVIEASAALYHLLSIVDSSLHSHLVELGVEPQYFALRWLRVLFGREFSLENLLVIWDEIFACENAKSNKAVDNGVLDSPRGAFISAFAVSMILNLRSSLLATEHATSCLQRLLNYPDDVKLVKLIAKAKSLQDLAVDANNNSSSLPILLLDNRKSVITRGHTLSLDSASPNTPLSMVPESYWEEKWRVLHKEENNQGPIEEQVPSRIKGWSESFKLRLSRTESDPSPSKIESTKIPSPSVRRSLLENLTREVKSDGLDERDEDVGQRDPVQINGQDFTDKNLGNTENGARSEDNSSNFEDPTSPIHGNIDRESEEPERSSVASNSSIGENDADSASNVAEFCGTPPSVGPTSKCSRNDDSSEKLASVVKERKLLFQWLWKFGRNANEGTSERNKQEESKTCNDGNGLNSVVETRTADACDNRSDGSSKGEEEETVDQNVTVSLRNLGQSMLENIQVIESVFQQDRSQTGSSENLANNGIVEKGQVTAMSALKELRKISNLLSEM
ncbi:hypothetical protein ACJIZ3_018931 [Penstemon smallii]|uniref:Rab-GAP TBC domain-containing protein n=1 Tax=Penstemon smallii TaxID=265156 RepID=A0ABD3SZQ3_9LAMI